MSRVVDVVLDSRHRVDKSNTDPGSYKIQFDSPLYECRSVEVLYAEIPGSMFNVTETENTFSIDQVIGGTTTTVTSTLLPGNYSASAFVTEINAKWAAAGGNATLVFSIDANTDQLRLTSTSATSLAVVKRGNFPYPFGWHTDGTVPGNGFLTAGGMVRLAHESAVYVYIPELNTTSQDIRCSAEGHELRGYGFLGRFQLRSGGEGVVNYFDDQLRVHRKILHNLPTLSTLTVYIKDGMGEIVNFHGVDHCFYLRVECGA